MVPTIHKWKQDSLFNKWCWEHCIPTYKRMKLNSYLTLCMFILSCFSCIWLLMTLCTVVHQPPLSMGFSRQEYWSGLPFSLPEDLPNPEIKPWSAAPALQADSLPLNHRRSPILTLYVEIDSKYIKNFKKCP